ncbi:hypothetical protein [Roseibium litorale]|uniref:Capsular polysaccharide transport system permease protein n=1 Tax=Roseibium litorale TaxID=2803841 RepID=A0ABR9CQD6_9HYPH|nr:hypothetical protein [Roseibium litorale]MBD8892481.1 hypothetical protein [Roseibium litorale]
MSENHQQVTETTGKDLVVRSQKMAAALSSYARALTFENRSRRNLYKLAGLAPRVRDQIFAKLLIGAFILCFAMPFTASVVYYSFIASKIYTSEVRFVVRSAAPMLSRDRYTGSTVEPKEKIVQDTAILLNYLDSPAMVQALQKQVSFKGLFGSSDIDFLSRLPDDATIEDVENYWEGKYSSWVNPKSGIIELEVSAFSAADANDLMHKVLKIVEDRINQLNSGMWGNLEASANKDVDDATEELATLRDKFRNFQNESGVFDVAMTADSIVTILTTLETGTAELKSRRDALAQSVAADAPQLAELDRQLAARLEQEQNLRTLTTGTDASSGPNLAAKSQIFKDIELSVSLAEKRLASAITELEKVKLVSSLQLVYLDAFTEPTMPDTNKYPNVPLRIFISLLICLSTWSVISGILVYTRHKLD